MAEYDIGIEKIIDRYGSSVYSFALSKLKSTDDADDVYQNVFYKLFEKKPHFANSQKLKAWLLKTAYNFAIDILRKKKHECELTEDIPVKETEFDSFADTLDTLPEKYRDAVYLFYAEDMQIKEIAPVLGLTPSGVKSRLSRAKIILRRSGHEGE